MDFIESLDIAEINVLCSDLSPEAGQEDYFVAGEGGPSEVINSTLYSVILKGKIALYREDKCEEPKIAVHELLHALGFDHNDNPNSILYPTLDCKQEIDSKIIEDINKLYSTDAKPDFKISSINASKAGRYLNFDIEVLNQGLEDSGRVDLTIYSGDKRVDNFDLGRIKIGARKILNVENLKIPIRTTDIRFVVDDADLVDELFEDNNDAELVLAGSG